jgi:tRNA 5-methylaminomethyl-2-thiouridine biosynthesis bifunctional protein
MTRPSPLTWRDDGLPLSSLYGDVYFSSDDGLAETQAVYLAGCGLPDAWAGRRRFTVAELGFGSGLNIAALLMLWREHRPQGGRLQIFSVEAHPMDAADARRALQRWPQIAPAMQALLAAWPAPTPGFHRLDLPGFDAVFDLAILPADEALSVWDGRADAWFLDGFSPALNPAMWTPQLMQAVADHSAPGAKAATFTVAGAVRRGLSEAGFAVERMPGYGRKRQRLEAVLPGARAETPALSVAVIGAGIAGASMMRALARDGADATLFEAVERGAGASGNPAALVTPAFDAGMGVRAKLYAQAHRRAVDLLGAVEGAVIATGAVQLEATDRDAHRFDAVAGSGLFDDLARFDAGAAAARLGEPAPGGLMIGKALVVEPAAVLAAWAPQATLAAVATIETDGGGWRLLGVDAQNLGRFDAVVLANGADMARLWPAAPLQSVRGQASWATGVGVHQAAAFGGYAIPLRRGVLFGATHDRDDADEDLRPADHARNLALLAKGLPGLAARLADQPLEGRARRRAATPDRMPIAGAIPGLTGLFVLGGLGSRGFCTAPLLAEHVAALMVGSASPLPLDLAAAVDPARPSLWRKAATDLKSARAGTAAED